MTEHAAPYLHVVRSTPTSASTRSEGAQKVETPDMSNQASSIVDATPAPPPLQGVTASDGDDAALSAAPSAPLAQAVMYAVVSWLALCVERLAVAVDIQPVADRLYEVSAHYDEEHHDGIILRVRLDVEPGLVVRTTVEPIRP